MDGKQKFGVGLSAIGLLVGVASWLVNACWEGGCVVKKGLGALVVVCIVGGIIIYFMTEKDKNEQTPSQ